MKSTAVSFFAYVLVIFAIAVQGAQWNLAIAPDTVGKPLRTLGSGDSLSIDMGSLYRNKAFQLDWNPMLRIYSLTSGKATGVQFVADNPWAAGGDSTWLLSAPPFRRGDAFWIRVQDLAGLLPATTGWGLTADTTSSRLQLSPVGSLLSLKLESRKNGDLAELRFVAPVRYTALHHAPHYLLQLQQVRLDSIMVAQTATTPLVRKVIAYPGKSSSQLTFEVSDLVDAIEVVERDSGRTLQIAFRKDEPSSSSLSASSSSTATAAPSIRTIILDPGHGGKDPGALGAITTESKVVLAVAKKLKDRLRKAGFQVRLTRETDDFIELRDRPKMASQWGGDLFVSLHCNAVEGKARRLRTEGYKVYILREAESEEDKAIARRENQAVRESGAKDKDELSPVDWILLQNQLNLYTHESERLAGHIVESFDGGSIRKLGSGAGQAGFYVLVGAFMPAALVEIGFITHPEDEKYMVTEKGQDEIARHLADAIIHFAKGASTP